jgi:hypothetical protein
MRPVPALLPALLFLAAPAPALAQQPTVTVVAPRVLADRPTATILVEPVGMAIASFDADLDGRTTRAELDAGLARSFAAIDTAKAGSIGYIGYGDWAKRWLGDANAVPSQYEVDLNHDNRITLEELQETFGRIFARLDMDHDGAVTREEVLTIRASGVGGGPRGKPGKK